jgi:hypothetical protein
MVSNKVETAALGLYDNLQSYYLDLFLYITFAL